jgi:hypothetical protein
LSFAGLNNGYGIDNPFEPDDSVFDQSLERNVLIGWLESNKPTNLSEINDLKYVVITSRFKKDVCGSLYSSGTYNDSTYLFGPMNILILSNDRSIDTMLDLIENMEDDMQRETNYLS